MDKILRVNIRTKEIKYEETPDEYAKTGGRGLISTIMLNEVNPTCEPLGKYNKLIFATGLLNGTNLSSSGRLSIGTKSPLTGGIKESNAGGITAMRLAQSGIKALIIEDIPDHNSWYYIKIGKDCSLEPADEYAGMGTFEFCEEMLKKYGDCAVSCIGQAGEMLYSASGIATMDKEKKPNRYSGRGGIGAVMGSKKIKAVVITGKGTVNYADKDLFSKAFKEYTNLVIEAPITKNYGKLGTASIVRVAHNLNGLPVRNYSGEKFELADNIYGETLFDLINARGGEGSTTHGCMPGCLIKCSNVVPDECGKTIVSPLEYETIGLLGSNLGIGNLDDIAKFNAICNDIGVDTIEIGGAIGVAMEAGLADFGDSDAVFNFLEQVKNGTPLGRVLGNGTSVTGKVFGIIKVPVVNGQCMAAYDPKTIKGMGITYATSTMGADHTFGPSMSTENDCIEAVKVSQKSMGMIDSLGLCTFVKSAIGKNHQIYIDLINGRFGWNIDEDFLKQIGEDTLRNEYKFNELAGFSAAKYRLPESFTTSCKQGQPVFDVSNDELDNLINAHK
ncbi:MAG: aldehyde ferredoxin oxidoreductase N-terminal domain-containing protein [Clostridiaceae bacterium]